MKKYFRKMLAFLIMLTMIGCTTKKTTVANQEEWDAALDISNYLNAKVIETLFSEEDDMKMVTTYLSKENIIRINDAYNDEEIVYYYVNDPDLLGYSSIYGDSNGIYSTEFYKFDSKEEQEENWEEILESTISPKRDEISNFADGTYDENKKCYCFQTSLLDQFPVDIEVYLENSCVIKRIEYITIAEDDIMTIETIYETNTKETFELPDLKNKVNNEEEWKSLFDVEKYSNCTSYYEYDDVEVISDITKDAISQTTYFDDSEDVIYRTITRVDDTKENVVEEVNDGEQIEYDIEYDDILTCFEDNFVILTYVDDLSDVYKDVKECSDHYEYESIVDGTKSLIKLYISNGYITKIENSFEFEDGSTFESKKTLDYFGKTYIY